MTTERTTTDTDATQNLRLIPDANLAQLDPRLKDRRQILDKLTEIDSSIRRKIKQQLIVIKGVFCIDQLHLQFMLADLFLTDLECLMLFFFILPFQLLVAGPLVRRVFRGAFPEGTVLA